MSSSEIKLYQHSAPNVTWGRSAPQTLPRLREPHQTTLSLCAQGRLGGLHGRHLRERAGLE